MKKEPNDSRPIRGQATEINLKLLLAVCEAIRKQRKVS
jgi:hypothetical protein